MTIPAAPTGVADARNGGPHSVVWAHFRRSTDDGLGGFALSLEFRLTPKPYTSTPQTSFNETLHNPKAKRPEALNPISCNLPKLSQVDFKAQRFNSTAYRSLNPSNLSGLLNIRSPVYPKNGEP